ncbi:tryptophan synthase subunit alpha [Phycisphaera mikurensis]|uniref:Tryptophan synthase alpha chain n=1 Tax=Phycisphaera mikurensis (strain NBRC 102666 / KCTC 22515 / FYK2301M01) TaxID=1142394 RepID=I0IEQ2_PHYMF|nr:tryptophan synthase subunit alpha [Phycisphaera mikurensis]MBB6441536.1 tryptophan synthase alpha chain [Phycisphaera mikurensis]BAM03740.1 tryptophan synthase alpha chain [Phycisphaera mikurensis NBRC 102666]
MPSRVKDSFAALRSSGRRGLMPFVTAGDPSLDDLPDLLAALEAGGATAVEVGIPFSDPVADGPVIAESMQHALRGGVTVAAVFAAVREARRRVSIPLVAMLSYSIVYRLGLDRFCEEAAAAGFDGLIIPDLAVEESAESAAAAARAGLTLSLLVAPSTPPKRAARLAEASTGFVYVVSRAGITGADKDVPEGLAERVAGLRAATDLPLAVGFGIASAAQVRQVVGAADAAIVGSALVRRLAGFRGDGHAAAADAARAFVAELAAGLPAPAAA